MNELVKEEKIENMIYEVRGKEVMLDSDLAKLYGCKNGTKTVNLAVKRHLNRFPKEFYFRLTETEFNNLRFQFETTNNKIRTLPYVFTEQGCVQLASILRTEAADEMSVLIVNAFVAMRHYIMNNHTDLLINMDNRISANSNKIKQIENTLNEMNKKEKVNTLFFEGQIYDAYSLLLDILKRAKKEIIIIDNYIDKNILDILSKTNKKVILYTNGYNNKDYYKYKKEYSNVKLIVTNIFHDRFIIIDRKKLYHSGASFKDLGVKCFAISKIEDKEILDNLIKHANMIK